MPPVGFEPTISAGEWQQTYALDRAATGTGLIPLPRIIHALETSSPVTIPLSFTQSISFSLRRLHKEFHIFLTPTLVQIFIFP